MKHPILSAVAPILLTAVWPAEAVEWVKEPGLEFDAATKKWRVASEVGGLWGVEACIADRSNFAEWARVMP